MPLVWWLSAIALSAGLLYYRRILLSTGDPAEKRVAALSLAALPMLWGLFSVLAFWTGYPGDGLGLALLGLMLAATGYLLQPDQ